MGTALALAAGLTWCYWATLVRLFADWQRDDNYSVGQLVPLAALYMLWHDRRHLQSCGIQPCWWGLALLVVAQAARGFGLIYLYESAERYSLVLTVAALVWLVAGTECLRRLRWILAFLLLAVPLPGVLHNCIAGPLQQLATTGAVCLLELFGVTVIREGNTLLLNHEVQVAVAEACSGLRMLTAFVVVAATLAYLVPRPRWQKITLLISSIPVAILCNLARLVVTAVLFLVASSATAERFFHDGAGLTMMPLALLILIGELWLMGRLIEEPPPRDQRT